MTSKSTSKKTTTTARRLSRPTAPAPPARSSPSASGQREIRLGGRWAWRRFVPRSPCLPRPRGTRSRQAWLGWRGRDFRAWRAGWNRLWTGLVLNTKRLHDRPNGGRGLPCGDIHCRAAIAAETKPRQSTVRESDMSSVMLVAANSRRTVGEHRKTSVKRRGYDGDCEMPEAQKRRQRSTTGRDWQVLELRQP
jgi:hypothetical protein